MGWKKPEKKRHSAYLPRHGEGAHRPTFSARGMYEQVREALARYWRERRMRWPKREGARRKFPADCTLRYCEACKRTTWQRKDAEGRWVCQEKTHPTSGGVPME